MRQAILISISVMISTFAYAQNTAGEAPGVEHESNRGALEVKAIVNGFRSATTDSVGGNVNTATQIRVTNLGSESCTIEAEFVFAVGTPTGCTVSVSRNPGAQAALCSRSFPDQIVLCSPSRSCDPELTENDGTVIIRTSGCPVAVSGTLLYTSSDDSSVLAAQNIPAFPIGAGIFADRFQDL